MKNQIDFQKFIPLSADKNINYKEPDYFKKFIPSPAENNTSYEKRD